MELASIQPPYVYLTTTQSCYGNLPEPPVGQEYTEQPTPALAALKNLWMSMSLDASAFGTPDWNPLKELIGSNKRVLIKPNWVRHTHLGGGDLDTLITHTSLIAGLLSYVGKTNPHSIVVGDAPVQGCDFSALSRRANLNHLSEVSRAHTCPFTVADYRLTIHSRQRPWEAKTKTSHPMDQYVLFDLGGESALEEISNGADFRVTMYDPRALAKTHAPGRHQYLVARAVLEAEVVISMPKLKTHKKAGITGALKNVVGINGHKEYLPHHRKGDPTRGGDCYARPSWVKRLAEECLDKMNQDPRPSVRRAQSLVARGCLMLARATGNTSDVEGSWHGNDTVWRMCLDLQRIVRFGRPDGTIAATPQRRVFHLTDAIIAGEGEGPMAPDPVPLGLVSFGENAAAIDWVHAWLMGFDPATIPLVREACAANRSSSEALSPEEICVWLNGQRTTWDVLSELFPRTFKPPRGWQGRCERNGCPGPSPNSPSSLP
jgi:uncharacterized protein (DUF362 family)